jgi:large subunit ribosomal protein L18
VNKQKIIAKQRQRRRYHSRSKSRGTSERPRLSVFRSHKHIACQVIDDVTRKTIVSASTRDSELAKSISYGGNKDAAAAIGKAVAEKAIAAGVQKVRFDRGDYRYHGRVAALADAAREAGLNF